MMVLDREIATELVFQAMDAVNELRDPANQLPKSLDVELFGQDGMLDSLAMTTLALSIERNIENRFGIEVDLLGNLVTAIDGTAPGTPAAIVDFILDSVRP